MALTRATDKIIANADGNLNLSGIVTAASFSGNGSGLIGVASTDNIITGTAATFTGTVNLPDNAELILGDSGDANLKHDQYRTILRQHGAGPFVVDLLGDNKSFEITRSNLSETVAKFNTNGPVDLYFDATKRIETASTGAVVTGILTATSFSGDGANLTGVSGFSTALSSTQGTLENLIFKTTESFTVAAGTSVRIESDNMSGNTCFTRLGRINVATGATFHVSAGTTFIMNVLDVF